MSNEYDSLEDDQSDKYSCDSLESFKTSPSDGLLHVVETSSSSSREPFRLHNGVSNSYHEYLFARSRQDEPEEEQVVSSGGRSRHSSAKIHATPISLKSSDTRTVEKIRSTRRLSPIEDNLMNIKGLQRNDDGSFSKSPRELRNDLPFVSREYRKSNFPKKKSLPSKSKKLDSNKKNSPSKEKGNDESTMDVIKITKEKGTSEVLANGSSMTVNEKVKSDYQTNDNLTDSMKEELLKTFRNKTSEIESKLNNIKKNGKFRILPSLWKEHESRTSRKDTQRNSLRPIQSPAKQRFKNFTRTDHFTSEKSNENTKRVPVARTQKPDLVLPQITEKPHLSYTERFQREKGYNPLCLQGWDKLAPADTDRSIFGDSTAEQISEVSSCGWEPEDEDEDAFYKRLIEKESLKKPADTSMSTTKTDINLPVGLASTAKQTRSRRSKSSNSSNTTTKPASIDLPVSKSPKKPAHGCQKLSPVSKAALLSKGRAYGRLVSSRNVSSFKLRPGNQTSTMRSSRSRRGRDGRDTNRTEQSAVTQFTDTRREVPEWNWTMELSYCGDDDPTVSPIGDLSVHLLKKQQKDSISFLPNMIPKSTVVENHRNYDTACGTSYFSNVTRITERMKARQDEDIRTVDKLKRKYIDLENKLI